MSRTHPSKTDKEARKLGRKVCANETKAKARISASSSSSQPDMFNSSQENEK